MKFPKSEEISEVLKKLEKLPDDEWSLAIDYKAASKIDVLKHKLCREFVEILINEKISQAELAERLNTDRAILNKIIHYRIENFTIDRLLELLARIKPIEISIKAAA